LKLLLDNLQHVKAHTGEKRYIEKLIESLPPETMRRLLIQEIRSSSAPDNGKEIIVPEGVTEIGDAAFKECLSLERVQLHIH
jgi:hypothetical protein